MRTAVGVAAVLGAVAFGASACGEDSEKTERGNCGSASYELSVDKEDKGLEVTFELQSAGPGESWNVVIEQDETTLLDGQRQTDEDGELDVDAFADEADGKSFKVTATPRAARPAPRRSTSDTADSESVCHLDGVPLADLLGLAAEAIHPGGLAFLHLIGGTVISLTTVLPS